MSSRETTNTPGQLKEIRRIFCLGASDLSTIFGVPRLIISNWLGEETPYDKGVTIFIDKLYAVAIKWETYNKSPFPLNKLIYKPILSSQSLIDLLRKDNFCTSLLMSSFSALHNLVDEKETRIKNAIIKDNNSELSENQMAINVRAMSGGNFEI